MQESVPEEEMTKLERELHDAEGRIGDLHNEANKAFPGRYADPKGPGAREIWEFPRRLDDLIAGAEDTFGSDAPETKRAEELGQMLRSGELGNSGHEAAFHELAELIIRFEKRRNKDKRAN